MCAHAPHTRLYYFRFSFNVSIKSIRTHAHWHLHGAQAHLYDGNKGELVEGRLQTMFHFTLNARTMYSIFSATTSVLWYTSRMCARVCEFASVFVAPYLKRRYSCLDKFMHERRCYPFFFVFIIDAHFDSIAVVVVPAAAATTIFLSLVHNFIVIRVDTETRCFLFTSYFHSHIVVVVFGVVWLN